MGILDKIELPRKMCPVIFLLDTSGSMYGAPIGAVNAAIESVLPELISMNDANPDNEIKVTIMTFDFDAEWKFGGDELLSPEEIKNSWNDLDANGYTSMGAAFLALNEKLSISHGFMKRASGSVAPVLFLLSDGEPTDEVLREFTMNAETVIHTDNPAELKKMIKFIAVTSSRVASKGNNLPLDGANANPDDNTQNVAVALKAQGGSLNASADEE